MFNKSKIFNYITLFFGLVTIGVTIYSIITNKSSLFSIIFLVITLIFYYISRKLNNKNINLTKEDKEMLDNIKANKQMEDKNVKKSSSNSR